MNTLANSAIKVVDSNSIEIWRENGKDPLIIKRYHPKPANLKMKKYTLLRYLGRQIPVEYLPPAQRRDFEKDCLRLWHQKGFKAPEQRSLPTGSNADLPALAIEFIKGKRLDQLLRASGLTDADVFDIMHDVFAEMRARHCIAIFEQEHRLIHYDANIRNLIYKDGQTIHIDFEMGHLDESINKSAAREVLKLLLQVLNQLGNARFDAILDLVVAAYGIRHILQRIVKENLDQKLLWYHLRRDQHRKKKNSGLITKFDVARGLQDRLMPDRQQQENVSRDHKLHQALETSWDGKFYQSLDDSDPRGRDMNHRYDVMQFPDSFKDLSVLDIGCNIGRICFDAKLRGAKRAVGIDNRGDVVTAMNRYYQEKDIDIELFAFDINEGLDGFRGNVGQTQFDYVFALSIWSHIDKEKLWEIINGCEPRVCILEDNAPSRIRSLDRIEDILMKNLNFSNIEFLGFTTDRGVRAVFRLTN